MRLSVELGQEAKIFTPLFPQPGVRVTLPAGLVTVEVTAASPKAQIRITSVGRSCTNWIQNDPAIAEALQRLDWRGVLAVASASTADGLCALCKDDDGAVEEALRLELGGELAVRHVTHEGQTVVVVELPLDGGRFRTSSCVSEGHCIGFLVDIDG
jgi:hypothetical protein